METLARALILLGTEGSLRKAEEATRRFEMFHINHLAFIITMLMFGKSVWGKSVWGKSVWGI
jgi:hypothetical protein